MPTDNQRELVHTRQISCRAFRLKNGFLEIEATLSDEKGQEVPFRSRPSVPVGGFMHRMSLTLTIDTDYVIQDVRAQTHQAPWPTCGETDAAATRTGPQEHRGPSFAPWSQPFRYRCL